MSLFEEHHHIPADERKPPLSGLLIRPAMLTDAAESGAMAAEREGGDASEYAFRHRRYITSLASSDKGIILVAEYEDHLIGVAKVRHFAPPPDAPANVAPPGWYLAGVIVVPEYRRRGVGQALTQARIDWIAERDSRAYYFANAQNRVSIELHQQFGFVELTRDFIHPWTTFIGEIGILFGVELYELAESRNSQGLLGYLNPTISTAA